MTRIERIYADFKPLFSFVFIRGNPLKSDLIRVLLPLIFKLFDFTARYTGHGKERAAGMGK